MYLDDVLTAIQVLCPVRVIMNTIDVMISRRIVYRLGASNVEIAF